MRRTQAKFAWLEILAWSPERIPLERRRGMDGQPGTAAA
jgi:hypothetical protein